jgi:hypothetical protein
MAAVVSQRFQKQDQAAFSVDMNGSATAVIPHNIGAGKINAAEGASTNTLPDVITITPVAAALFAAPPLVTAIDANSFTVTVNAADNAEHLLVSVSNGFHR